MLGLRPTVCSDTLGFALFLDCEKKQKHVTKLWCEAGSESLCRLKRLIGITFTSRETEAERETVCDEACGAGEAWPEEAGGAAVCCSCC